MKLLHVIHDIFKGDKKFSKIRKEHKNAKESTGWTIYGSKEPVNKLTKRLYDIHSNLKKRILTPIAWLLGRYTKKHYKGIPNEPHNANLIIFDRAFDKALEKWHVEYLGNAYKEPVRRSPEYWKELQNKGSGKMMRTAKETTLLLAMNDTAYRAFFDMFAYEFARQMGEHYKDKPINHLLYMSSSIADPNYYYMHHCIKSGQMSVYKTTDSTCCELQAIQSAAEMVAADAKGELLEQAAQMLREGKKLPPDAHKVIEILQNRKQ